MDGAALDTAELTVHTVATPPRSAYVDDPSQSYSDKALAFDDILAGAAVYDTVQVSEVMLKNLAQQMWQYGRGAFNEALAAARRVFDSAPQVKVFVDTNERRGFSDPRLHSMYTEQTTIELDRIVARIAAHVTHAALQAAGGVEPVKVMHHPKEYDRERTRLENELRKMRSDVEVDGKPLPNAKQVHARFDALLGYLARVEPKFYIYTDADPQKPDELDQLVAFLPELEREGEPAGVADYDFQELLRIRDHAQSIAGPPLPLQQQLPHQPALEVCEDDNGCGEGWRCLPSDDLPGTKVCQRERRGHRRSARPVEDRSEEEQPPRRRVHVHRPARHLRRDDEIDSARPARRRPSQRRRRDDEADPEFDDDLPPPPRRRRRPSQRLLDGDDE